MKVIQLSRADQDIIRNNNGMLRYLEGLSKGRDATPHSWLYEREQSEETLKRWIPIMEKANLRHPLGKEFIQFDLKQVEKFGPQGKIPPFDSDEVKEVLDPIYTPSKYDNEQELSRLFPKAREYAAELFGNKFGRLEPLRFEQVIDDMRDRDTLSTNSGWPRFTRRERVKEQEIADAVSGNALNYPAIILFRQYNTKLRPVWMYPMSANIYGNRFAQPLQRLLRESPSLFIREYVTPWTGYDMVKRVLTEQWPQPSPIVGGDTTKMDAHMRPAQIRLVFEIVKWAFKEQYWEELWNSMARVNTIPLVVSPTTAIIGTHGLASGAEWTQITETVLTSFLAWLLQTRGQGIGDDFYWLTKMTNDEVVEYLSQVGLPANRDKQDVGVSRLTFLQRLNQQGFLERGTKKHILGGYYPTIRALNSSLNPERFHSPKVWNSDMFCIRQYMILENCVDDPCFAEFVQFVVRGQKDLIPFAKMSAEKLVAIQKQARQIPGLNPSYNQEKREKPLSEFASINLAKRL